MLAVCVCVPHRLMHDIILLRLSSIQSFIFFHKTSRYGVLETETALRSIFNTNCVPCDYV